MTVYDVIASIRSDPNLDYYQKEKAIKAVLTNYPNPSQAVDPFTVKSLISAALGWGIAKMLGGSDFSKLLGSYLGFRFGN